MRLPSTVRVRRWLTRLGVLVLAVGLAAVGWWGYATDQDSRELNISLYTTKSLDRIDVSATVLRVDPTIREAVMRVQVTPQGAYADPQQLGLPSKAIILYTTSASRAVLNYPAETPPAEQTINVPVNSGWPTDYPQDRYSLTIGFIARVGDADVPVNLDVASYDSLFVLKGPEVMAADASAAALNLTAKRSRGGWLLAWFMMIVAWALALVVAGAAWMMVSGRRGLVWPGFGWMAATLFALLSLRNSAPGSPPIGSLIDYLAFFWAEGIVAASLVAAVLTGIMTERAAAAAPAG